MMTIAHFYQIVAISSCEIEVLQTLFHSILTSTHHPPLTDEKNEALKG